MSEVDKDGFRRMALARCPYCDAQLSGLGVLGASDTPKPHPGDATICMYCAQVLVFSDELLPRKPNPEELEAAFAEDPAFARSLEQTQQAIRSNQRGRA